MDRAEGRRDEMLLPALGNGRLPRKQGAEVLKGDRIRECREQCEPNAERRSTRPPTQRRNYTPSAQRHRNALLPPAAGWRQRDMFFYEPINLAKVLTAGVHAAPS
jgi:hypothetical protein